MLSPSLTLTLTHKYYRVKQYNEIKCTNHTTQQGYIDPILRLYNNTDKQLGNTNCAS